MLRTYIYIIIFTIVRNEACVTELMVRLEKGVFLYCTYVVTGYYYARIKSTPRANIAIVATVLNRFLLFKDFSTKCTWAAKCFLSMDKLLNYCVVCLHLTGSVA